MRLTIHESGYPTVRLWHEGKSTLFYVHHLVLRAFIGDCPDGMEACHGDGDPSHCHPDNLRWDTHLSNVADTITHGRVKRGEDNALSKLKTPAILDIRQRLKAGETMRHIAEEHGVSTSCVNDIDKRRSWSWLIG